MRIALVGIVLLLYEIPDQDTIDRMTKDLKTSMIKRNDHDIPGCHFEKLNGERGDYFNSYKGRHVSRRFVSVPVPKAVWNQFSLFLKIALRAHGTAESVIPSKDFVFRVGMPL
mmetsp:Transcript_4657/g.9936  ORF Transcript_4657/g.9936 Transcript_4657/m.9936 type:complete len:113 (-) Transcript_4657:644-982(-)